MNDRRRAIGSAMLAIAFLTGFIADGPAVADPVQRWSWEWLNTDFTKRAVEFSEIISGGPPKDGIPSIDKPLFRPAAAMTSRDLAPNGKVLVPNDPGMRAYGDNPYVAYDSASAPFLFNGDLPDYIAPMVRVVVVDGKAWSMPMLRDKGTHRDGDLLFTWSAGQNSALDADTVHQGRDVGNITVQRAGADVVYDVTFAFVYHVFHGGRRIVTE